MMKKTKTGMILLTITIVFTMVFMAVQTYATDPKYLNIIGEREGDEENEIYTITNIAPPKTIWKIVSYDSMDPSATAKYDEAIYCINPEIGFGSELTAGNDRKEYNASFNMKNLTNVEQKYRDMFPDQTKYNSILWILDNCYLPKQTPEADKEMVKQALYAAAGIKRDVLTDNDIEVVQQLALWYFSSEKEGYHYEPENFPSIAINETAIEEIGQPFGNDGIQRMNDMKTLYTYFITSAKANAASYGTEDIRELEAPSIRFTKPADNTITTIEKIGGVEYFVAGPYHIEEENNTKLPYTVEGTVLDQTGTAVTDYKIFDSNKTVMENAALDKSILGQDFYIAVPTTNKTVTKIALKVKADYITTTATCWTHSENYATEQPVVIVEKDPHEIEIKKEVNVKQPEFDLSLRKFITQINEQKVTNRVPEVDVSGLKDGSSKTAKYEHPKDPLLVETGDIVIYTIRVYNEGEANGYAAEITDNIPEGLRFLAEHDINKEYRWQLSKDKTKITTDYLSKEQGTSNELLAFDPDTMDTLDYKDVKVAFEVTEPNGSDRILTNIAEISKDTDSNGDEITDRDSTPDNNVENEDDIDQEHLKLKEFDLSLRKFITQINDQAITDRVPQVDVSGLKNGKSKTAKYEHPKNALPVETGDIVIYTIRVYNEGETNGYAAEITDNIPEGLKFLPENAINKEYRWKASEDGTKITTDYLSREQGTSNELLAFDPDTMDTLDYKDVKVAFEVIEPNGSDRILTNIAEISKDTDKNGNEVIDRDSTPDNNVENEDDIDQEHLKLKEFDLSLRKFITQINEQEITDREPQVDVSGLKDGSSKTAKYEHSKTPLGVQTGDIVIYTIRVYNEGETNGYAAEITDNIPEGLRFLVKHAVNIEYMWRLSEDGTKITTDYLSREKDEKNELLAFDPDTMDTLHYKDVKVAFEVVEPNGSDRILTNIAEISKDTDKNGDEVIDRDSTPDNNVEDEDDIDQEHVKLQHFDLSLRKFITKVNSKVITDRVPQVDVSGLVDGSSTTAKYTHSKTPVGVQTGDIIVYTIRVYNEGKIDGYAEEITDIVPEGLRFIPAENSSINSTYRWVVSSDGKTITTDYLSEARSKENIIKAFDKTAENPRLDYKDVQVEFEVVEPNTSERILRNIAEITEDSNKDVDSTPDNVDPDKYTPPTDNSSYQEDDDDYEDVKLQYFDLSLRKFITKINEQEVTSRIPQVSLTEEGKLKYDHPKDPILVANNDIVIYTIRVYNEGKIAGYAKEVTDDIPAGLSYLPEHEINKKYEWVVSEDGKTVSTDYLSKEKSEAREEDNLLKAFDKTKEISDEAGKLNPDYRDIQIAFKITENNLSTDRIIINTAEITDDSDENGNDIEDEDSTPGNNVEEEDDLDKEAVQVKYFDLSLLKWVSKVYVTENGKTTVKETGHTGLENPEPVVKVDLDRKNIKNLVIKFGYTIQITNEGEIAGYAKEISDYIPEGLRFVKADNPDWEEKDGKIVTRKLENTLLEPGESASVEVILTWINDAENVGLKVNVAEISEDYNEHNSKDIDSIPDNQKEGEDDIDDAPVILTINTGSMPTYIGLGITILSMLAGGIFLIKKYVLEF